MMSAWLPDSIFLHDLQTPQESRAVKSGLTDGLSESWFDRSSAINPGFFSWQLHAVARAMAAACLPTPSVPVKRKA
jgi:hypothetical protein